MRYLLFLLLPLLSFGQIKSSEAAYRFQNEYVGLKKGGSVLAHRNPGAIPGNPTPELYTTANALSRTNEADATTGISTVGITMSSIEISPSPQDGTSLILMESTDQDSDRIEIDLTLEIGKEYVIKYWAWEDTGGFGRATIWVGFDNFAIQDWTETPTEYTHTVTANSANQKLRFYNFGVPDVYIDGLSIKESNPTQDPPPGGTDLTLSTLKAFPSAQGGGSIATGGRGGTVIHVTNLNNSGTGSLRAALTTTGARTIVFDVSGQINLTSRIKTGIDEGDFTIAGQTAPEGGITVTGFPLEFGATSMQEASNNWIVRNIRIRNGKYTGVADVPDHNGILSYGADDWIIDHVSFSFNDDQAISIVDNWGPVTDGTVQRSLFSQNATNVILGLGNGTVDRISFLLNMFVNATHRQPNSGVIGRIDIINNASFNWPTRMANIADGANPDVNYIGNYMVPGGGTTTNRAAVVETSSTTPLIYTANNYHPSLYPTPQLDDRNLWRDRSNSYVLLGASYFTTSQYTLLSNTIVKTAAEAYASTIEDVGANYYVTDAGVLTKYLDDYDSGLISDFETLTSRGQFNKTYTQPTLPTNTRPGGYYSTLANIPEWFVTAHSITSESEVKASYTFDGVTVTNDANYTAFEMYLAYCAGDFKSELLDDRYE